VDPARLEFPLGDVAERFGLGAIEGAAPERHGGVNRLWRLRTERGEFSVHVLLGLGAVTDPVQRCQNVYGVETAVASAGVRVARAIAETATGTACVMLPGVRGPVVVHEWVDAETVGIDRTASSVYERLGRSLAIIHSLDLPQGRSGADLLQHRPAAKDWRQLALRADAAGFEWASRIRAAADELEGGLAIVDEWDRAAGERQVLSHRDLTSENILDDHGVPVLIDWEDAGPIGPGTEIGRTALDNLGRDGVLDDGVLRLFLAGYREVAPLPPVGPHWCSLWVRGLILYAEHCARSCVDVAATTSLLERQSLVVGQVVDELRRRLAITDSLVAAFEAASR